MEAAASSCLSAILSKIGGYLWDLCVAQANYLLHFENNVEDLKKEAGNLRGTRDLVQQEVKRAQRNTEEIEERVEQWQGDVDNILVEFQRLEDDIKVEKTFLCGRCPDLKWLYNLGMRTVKMTSEMSKLRESGNFIRVAHPTPLPGVEGPKDFISFKSTEDAFSQIMEALKNDNMVGLYGMGGVGKTTLAEVVRKEAKEKKLFDEVVMVTVSQNPNVKNIQSQIANLLGLKFEKEEEKEETLRAQRLCLRLKMEKKILIILDDVWRMLELTTIGILFGDAHKGCTILLTTRRQKVCIDMKCQKRIQLDTLSDDEALTLFKKHANICDSPELNAVAKEVVGECGGLPIAIKAIGSALRETDVDEWEVVSKKLKMSKLSDIETIDQNVYACLKLSYDYLKVEETKFWFLLCSLFPEDYEIDLEELLRYGLGLDLYGVADTIDEARKELCVTIKNLKASCLLLDAKEGHVKMHDLVRDVALWITSKGENVFMVKAGMRLTERPKHQGLEQCTAISLMGNRIEVLPDSLVCPKLKILLLTGNYIVEVSDEFFEEMKTLKVASLNRVHLSLNSLQSLTNLVTLQLIHCELTDISSIKKLAQLEILRLKGSGIVELPKELEELSKLRMLDITGCYNLERIPANVIQRLSQLEELYIGEDSFTTWEVEGRSAEQSNASLSELSQLYYLTILSLCINVLPCLPKEFVLPTKLLRYDISVNDDYDVESYPKSRTLRIKDIEATSLVAFKALYEKVEYLDLMSIKGCCYHNMVPSVDSTGLNELKRLSIRSFDELECIIDTTQQQDVPSTAFSNLVDLSLDECDGLREICSGGRPPRGFLENLETLDICNCKSMSNSLFPSWVLIQGLRKLKKVNVERCGELEDVFQLEGLCYAKENPFLLSSLESLDLWSLQNLKYIWKGPTQQVWLQSLTVVIVRSCHQLRYIFTLSLARSLLQLEQLTVRHCHSLKYIVEIKEAEENVGEGGGNDVMFPKLRKLQLYGLEDFISFFDSENYSSTWPALQELSLNLPLNSTTSFLAQLEANMLQTSKEKLRVLEVGIMSDQLCNSVLAQLIHGFQNLEELTIKWCRVSQLELSLPSLKVLALNHLEELECLCKGPMHLLSQPNLKKLEVWSCDRLRHMLSPSLARNLLQLEELSIGHCGELDQIFNEDDAEYNQTLSKDHLQWPLLFPNLSSINIQMCHKLKSLFPVSMTHLFSLQNLKKLSVHGCNRLRHMFSPNLARNLLQLEELSITDCGELEQIFNEDDATDMTSHKEMVLPQLQMLSLQQLESLVNFCPVGYHFIFQSLSKLFVTKCPKLTTRFSVDRNRSVHAEAKAPQIGKEDVDIEQSHPKTTGEIKCWDFDDLQKQLPPYIGK